MFLPYFLSKCTMQWHTLVALTSVLLLLRNIIQTFFLFLPVPTTLGIPLFLPSLFLPSVDFLPPLIWGTSYPPLVATMCSNLPVNLSDQVYSCIPHHFDPKIKSKMLLLQLQIENSLKPWPNGDTSGCMLEL